MSITSASTTLLAPPSRSMCRSSNIPYSLWARDTPTHCFLCCLSPVAFWHLTSCVLWPICIPPDEARCPPPPALCFPGWPPFTPGGCCPLAAPLCQSPAQLCILRLWYGAWYGTVVLHEGIKERMDPAQPLRSGEPLPVFSIELNVFSSTSKPKLLRRSQEKQGKRKMGSGRCKCNSSLFHSTPRLPSTSPSLSSVFFI